LLLTVSVDQGALGLPPPVCRALPHKVCLHTVNIQGAGVQDIFWQFLLEALTLSAAGGVLGVLCSVPLSLALPSLAPQLAGLHARPTWLEAAAALVAAIAIGLIFGAYPARRAAQTDPIQALRRG
jgi:putative ABC transport system permease protein